MVEELGCLNASIRLGCKYNQIMQQRITQEPLPPLKLIVERMLHSLK
jgi:hypothetical protein